MQAASLFEHASAARQLLWIQQRADCLTARALATGESSTASNELWEKACIEMPSSPSFALRALEIDPHKPVSILDFDFNLEAQAKQTTTVSSSRIYCQDLCGPNCGEMVLQAIDASCWGRQALATSRNVAKKSLLRS